MRISPNIEKMSLTPILSTYECFPVRDEVDGEDAGHGLPGGVELVQQELPAVGAQHLVVEVHGDALPHVRAVVHLHTEVGPPGPQQVPAITGLTGGAGGGGVTGPVVTCHMSRVVLSNIDIDVSRHINFHMVSPPEIAAHAKPSSMGSLPRE